MEFLMLVPPSPLLRFGLVIGCCGALLAGCGKKDSDQPAAAKSGQVVAHVAGQTITTQELENEFRLANIPPDKQKEPALVKRVLGELVLRKYLLTQALNAKLDREPGVLLDLLRAREQVLEAAYLVRTATAKAPSKADVDKYIASNPSKFATRKVFSVEQVVFPFGPAAQSLVEGARDTKSLDEIAQKMTASGIPFNRSNGGLSSGDLPNDFITRIAAKNPDDIFFIRSGANGLFFKVLGEESRPLEGDAAYNVARQLMRADAIKAEAGMAGYTANLEAKYEGDYAKIMQADPNAK
jgi:EpsD family peptidyl-prolyl cis-trans isomerase